MHNKITNRGFQIVVDDRGKRIIQQSSAIGLDDDGFVKPGSWFLWIGEHHLNRSQVTDIVRMLNQWLDTGKLFQEPTHD